MAVHELSISGERGSGKTTAALAVANSVASSSNVLFLAYNDTLAWNLSKIGSSRIDFVSIEEWKPSGREYHTVVVDVPQSKYDYRRIRKYCEEAGVLWLITTHDE